MSDDDSQIKNEIDYWKIHLESIDRTNIEMTNSTNLMLFNTILVIFVAMVIGILSINEIHFGWRIGLDIFISILFFFYIKKFIDKHKKRLNHHNLNLIVRERMIKERYENLGVFKDKLNKEFEDLKNIHLNSKNIVIEHLIKDYYKSKKV